MKNLIMIEDTKIKIDEGVKRTGKDEMNLVELPFTLLTKRNPKGLKTFERTWIGKGEDGKEKKFYKIVTGSDKWGLPTFIGEEVYLACMELSYRQGFKDRTVYTSQYDLLKLLGWTIGGSDYKRLLKAFNQLSGILISTNAFWNNEQKKYQKLGFGLIDEYCFFEDEIRGRKKQYRQLAIPLGYFRWNETFFNQSLRKNNIKTINTGLYFSLRSYISKRLYRFIDKKLYNQESFEIDLYKLAFEKLEMMENYKYPSKIIQNLKPAIEELKERKIAEIDIKKSKTESKYKVCFGPISKPLGLITGIQNSNAEEIVNLFHEKRNPDKAHQPTEKEIDQAKELLSKYDREKVEYIINYAIEQAKKTNFEMCYFGAVLNYVNEGLNQLNKEKEKIEKEKALLQKQEKLSKYYQEYEKYKKEKIDTYLKEITEENRQQKLERIKKELYEKTPISRTWGEDSQVLKSTLESHFIEEIKEKIKLISFEDWVKEQKITI